MNAAIKATVRDRRIELAAPEELADGTEVLIDITPVVTERIGIDESQWRDDPEALADWEAWLKTIEPIEWTTDEAVAFDCFEKEFRRFNLEAVRQQMQQ